MEKLGPGLLAWPLIYLACRQLATPRPPGLRGALRSWLWNGDAFCHLWLLYMVAGLAALTPLLRCRISWRRGSSVST